MLVSLHARPALLGGAAVSIPTSHGARRRQRRPAPHRCPVSIISKRKALTASSRRSPSADCPTILSPPRKGPAATRAVATTPTTGEPPKDRGERFPSLLHDHPHRPRRPFRERQPHLERVLARREPPAGGVGVVDGLV